MSAVGARILRRYYEDIVGRYYGRTASRAEVDAAMRDEPSDDLTLPGGLFLVSARDNAVAGCGGLRFVGQGLAEVTRVFVVPGARGLGLGAELLGELERHALRHGISRLRLDTRRDLVEARALYAGNGYQEVAAFNSNPYASHWFAKSLTS